MMCYFISDDIFFLYGIEDAIRSRSLNSRFITITHTCPIINPRPGDILILAINNSHLRSRLLRLIGSTKCRVVLIADIPQMRVHSDDFPWLLPKAISTSCFLSLLDKLPTKPCNAGKISRRVLFIFNQLGSGSSVSSLERCTRLQAKYIYKIKQSVFNQYGLNRCNSTGILLCRDMLRMNTPI